MWRKKKKKIFVLSSSLRISDPYLLFERPRLLSPPWEPWTSYQPSQELTLPLLDIQNSKATILLTYSLQHYFNKVKERTIDYILIGDIQVQKSFPFGYFLWFSYYRKVLLVFIIHINTDIVKIYFFYMLFKYIGFLLSSRKNDGAK